MAVAFILTSLGFAGLLSNPARGQVKLPDDKPKLPARYTLKYPVAERFCPPIQTTFSEVRRTSGRVGRKRFRQRPNGGYGLPVIDKVEGKNLLHVGADLGWYRVGEPVFAVGNGVVRLSVGPPPVGGRAPTTRTATGIREQALALPWGNLVVIEHRLPGAERYVTTLYGHLDNRRLVQTGDVVRAGQAIGTIGKKSVKINGGYNPHLHFGVRDGRIAEKGMRILDLVINGKSHAVTVVELGEDEIQVDLPPIVPERFPVALPAGRFTVSKRDGKFYLPAKLLWHMQRPDFPIVGYALSKEGWFDPVMFLRQRRADTQPAPFLPLRLPRSPRAPRVPPRRLR